MAGVPLTNDFRATSRADLSYSGVVKRFADFRSAAGLMAEVEVSENLSLEANGLYRRLHLSGAPDVVVTWEIPIMAKYTFSGPAVKPSIELGPSFRPTGNLNNTDPSHYGIAAGAGVEARVQRIRFTPSLGYTRWAADNHVNVSQQPLTKRDQVELQVGVSF